MSKYIDAEAFFNVINTLPYKDTSYPDASAYNGAISDVADMLTHFPAADVAEVRHGHWEFIGGYGYQYRCSVCVTCAERKTKFCSNCGARMDGDVE